MSECRIPIVQNTLGERAQFSLDRLVRDVMRDGMDLEAARAAGRQLLADLDCARVDVVTTDAIRHWLAERDPLVFARRRGVRARDADGRWRYLDPVLGRITALADTGGPRVGPIVAELLLDYFRPGAGDVLFQDLPDGTMAEKAPKLEELEGSFGALADDLLPTGADFSRPGMAGTIVSPPNETGKRVLVYISANDDIDRDVVRPGVLPGCDERWVLYLDYGRTAPGCAGIDYRALTRAAIIQAIAYAFRLCRRNPRCNQADVRLLHAVWTCGSDLANVGLRLEVRCVAI
jgi:hypothetical protein